MAYPLAASQAYDENHHEEKRFNIFISIPFDWGDDVSTPRRQIYMSANSTTFDDQGFATYKIIRDYQEAVEGVGISSIMVST